MNEYGEIRIERGTPYFIEDNIHVIVRAYPNFGDEHNHYILLQKIGIDSYCRLSMLEPRYIGYPDESLVLTIDDISEIIYILKEHWEDIIKYTNQIHEEDDKNYGYFYVPLPMDLPIPDYTRLIPRT